TLIGVVGPSIILGARQINRLSSYRMAVLSVFLTMMAPLPIITVPIGIWVLLRLSRENIREAFRLQRIENYRRDVQPVGLPTTEPDWLVCLARVLAVPASITGAVGSLGIWLEILSHAEEMSPLANGEEIWPWIIALVAFLFAARLYAVAFEQ